MLRSPGSTLMRSCLDRPKCRMDSTMPRHIRTEGNRLFSENIRPLVQPREIQQIVDQLQQPQGVAMNENEPSWVFTSNESPA